MNRTLATVLGITQTLVWATSYYMPAVGVGPAAASMGESTTLLVGGFSLSMLIQGLALVFLPPSSDSASGSPSVIGASIRKSG